MSIIIRKSEERGYFDHEWLKSYHTFSFAEYYDENFMEFGSLRVINDDIIASNTGFGLHPHRNMEIITYILDGTLTHSDNLGNKEEIKTGEVQVMSAGRGIVHSEWNHSAKPCHLLQIWIKPNQHGGEPGYKIYKPEHFEKWGLVASNDGRSSSLQIKQNAEVYVLDSGLLKAIDFPKMDDNKKVWLHVAVGEVVVDGITLQSGDAIGFNDGVTGRKCSNVMLFYV